MKQVKLHGGERIPALGQGTWRMGERTSDHNREVAAVRAGIEAGLTLIDTAEMYGNGGAERIVGEAMGHRRDELFLVSKVFPHNASRAGVRAACEASLERLGTDRLDLYLLHWRGSADLAGTVAGFEELQREGLIHHWGVSNFDAADLADLWAVPGGDACSANQLLYHLGERTIEHDPLPWMRQHGLPAMAYCPLGQGRLLEQPGLRALAERNDITPAQAALAWLQSQDDVIAIPKTSSPERQAENHASAEVTLNRDQLDELEQLFPRPKAGGPLPIV
ncbi:MULTISPECIES: aldo/keto reductase [Halomonadaceae]|uniref:Aldo/keto reductase n=1 Tax=Vreelandella halophila TaxID=86177 RepID=A0A9X4YCB3_9GAMM|nr:MULTISPECIES: aldo/keto reductase [Halomonas]MYL27062.1 aldo/keto reductase [Halomonas utahensis]MYL74264.1 aldo/keto reductase [Halomonas sp. 22501_18_FS]